MAHEHDGHRARMRERFRTGGLEGFAPHEVLELMLFYAIPQRNVNPLAHKLLEVFGSLQGVLEASPEELAAVEGVGEYAATLLSLFGAAGRRLSVSRNGEAPVIGSSAEAREYCKRLLSGLKQEHFYAICLNARMQVLGKALIARGSVGDVGACPRLVAEAALRMNARAVLLTHNHPGGSCDPSPEDMEITGRLASLLSGMEVILTDHVIVGEDQAVSLAEMGLITFSGEEQP